MRLNAFVISLISSGKTFADAVEVFVNEELGEEDGKVFKKNVLSKRYDECFSYRFLSYLRNYSQHGHLPVSERLDGRFCFDLMQIINSRHIKVSKSMKQSMKEVYEEIVEKIKEEPYLAFTGILDSFTVAITEIYYCFMKEIEDIVKQYHEERLSILEEHPEYVCAQFGELQNVVIFDVEEEMLHVFSAKDNLWNIYREDKKYAKEKMQYYQSVHTEPISLK